VVYNKGSLSGTGSARHVGRSLNHMMDKLEPLEPLTGRGPEQGIEYATLCDSDDELKQTAESQKRLQ
jgi:hypothetical protein